MKYIVYFIYFVLYTIKVYSRNTRGFELQKYFCSPDFVLAFVFINKFKKSINFCKNSPK